MVVSIPGGGYGLLEEETGTVTDAVLEDTGSSEESMLVSGGGGGTVELELPGYSTEVVDSLGGG